MPNEDNKILKYNRGENFVKVLFVIYADDENKKYNKVRDHCHYTGKYRGASSNICNLRYI